MAAVIFFGQVGNIKAHFNNAKPAPPEDDYPPRMSMFIRLYMNENDDCQCCLCYVFSVLFCVLLLIDLPFYVYIMHSIPSPGFEE